MRSMDDRSKVLSLIGAGTSDRAIALATAIPRTTIRDWRRKSGSLRIPPQRCPGDCPRVQNLPPDYVYLLGLYLGDGSISHHPRAYRLRITMDLKYPAGSSIRAPGPSKRSCPVSTCTLCSARGA